MGFINRFKKATGAGGDKKKEESIDKKAIKGVAKAGVALFHVLKAIMMFIISMWKFILVAFAVAAIIVCFDYIIERVTGETTPSQIYALAEVEDVKDLVEIKQNDDGEYYLGWVEDIDEKLENIVNYMNENPGVHNLPDSPEFLKKIIKAEIITQFPDLGGEVPADSDGFQGAVDIKRVSPNKEIGAVENKGAGETYSLESEIDNGDVEEGNYEETVKQWQSGKKLIIKNTATVYKQTESELNPGSDTGDWQPVYNEKTSSNLKIEEGEEVEYLGTYKNNTNPLTETVTTYVEVKHGDTQGFVKAQYLIDPEADSNSNKETTEEASIIRTSQTVTSRAKGDNKKTVANENEEYTIAIAAGHNSSNNTGASHEELKEEEMTIKVAEKVEEIFEEYSNVTVVQTGSTSDNPDGVQVSERTKLAREANPDLCIQIHFNSGGGTGVEVIYKENDGISQQLAEILSEAMSSKMSLENRGAKTDTEIGKNLSIIENAATSKFPSVVTEGGFLDGDYEYLKTDEAIDEYAQGIVDGVIRYLESDHSGYTSTATISETATESIESKVRNMKYVAPETMESYLNSTDETEKKKALEVFTIDEEGNIVTATWSYNNNTTEISKNSRTINLSTALDGYTVPFEYLLYFYIDTNEEDFSSDLADEILNTEIVLAVEDNVTTVKTSSIIQGKELEDGTVTQDWTDDRDTLTEVVTESCSTSIGFTYIDCWFVKAYRDNSYSEAVLNMGDEDEIVINISGTATESETEDLSAETLVASEDRPTGEKDEDGNDITKKWERYERTVTTTTTIRHQYDPGEMTTEGKEEVFVKLYKENDMQNWVRELYLFAILENNDKTKNRLLELTKYLIYKSTGINYGEIEFDFSEYSLNAFTSTGAGGGYTFTGSDSILWKNNFTKEQFVAYLQTVQVPNPSGCASGSGLATNQEGWDVFFKNCGGDWFDICTSYGIDPIVIMSWALNESGYGTSRYAQERGNLWGWGAYDSNPDNAWSGTGNEKSDKAMALLQVICASLKETTDNPTTHWRYQIAVNNGLANPDLTTILGTAYWYCSKPESWTESCCTIMKNIFGDFIAQYCTATADVRIGTINLTGENAKKMTEMLNEAIRIADDDRYTYSQANRYGEFQYDCSSFVYRLYKQYFGIEVPKTTSSYGSANCVGDIGSVELQPGDVLYRSGHVEIYLGNNLRVGAHSAKVATADQISVKDYPGGSAFTKVYRFIQ